MNYYCKRCDQHIDAPECRAHGSDCVLVIAGAFPGRDRGGINRTAIMGDDGKPSYFHRVDDDARRYAEWRSRCGLYDHEGAAESPLSLIASPPRRGNAI